MLIFNWIHKSPKTAFVPFVSITSKNQFYIFSDANYISANNKCVNKKPSCWFCLDFKTESSQFTGNWYSFSESSILYIDCDKFQDFQDFPNDVIQLQPGKQICLCFKQYLVKGKAVVTTQQLYMKSQRHLFSLRVSWLGKDLDLKRYQKQLGTSITRAASPTLWSVSWHRCSCRVIQATFLSPSCNTAPLSPRHTHTKAWTAL